VRKRVAQCRQLQLKRQGKPNAHLKGNEIMTYCLLSQQDQDYFEVAMEKLRLSARAYHRILRLSRTIADLNHSQDIQTAHLEEALAYRG